MWAFPMNSGGARALGALVKMLGVPSGGNSTLVYFSCDDCATEAGRVAGAGGRIHKEKFAIGELRVHRTGVRHRREHVRAAFHEIDVKPVPS